MCRSSACSVGQALVGVSGGSLRSQPTSLISTALVASRLLALGLDLVLAILGYAVGRRGGCSGMAADHQKGKPGIQ
ncbi:MAG: hypothetical protein R3F59_28530 [Myxococcota bacterium]